MKVSDKNFDDRHRERLVRLPEVVERIGASGITIKRWERANAFPKRRKIGPGGTIGWLASEIDAFIEGRWEP